MKNLTAVCFYTGLLIAIELPILHAEESAGEKFARDPDGQKFENVARWEYFVEREGKIYDPKTNQPHTGFVALRYGNEGLALGHCRDGMLDGTSTSWYPNGEKRSEHTYRQGWLEGLSTTWYANGQKISQGQYHQGKLHGVWISWDERGNQIEEHTYRDGVRSDR